MTTSIVYMQCNVLWTVYPYVFLLRHSELLTERKLLDCSRQQSNQLASKVDDLGFQLDQMQHEKCKVSATTNLKLPFMVD